jgi:hypothetical protein
MYLPAPSEGGNFQLTPAGTHLGICYRVIDLGTQPSNYNGEAKTAHKVLISWELPDEKMEDGRPFTVSSSYTWSMHEKSNLRKHLEAWRGQAFTERDFGPNGFDIKNVLGKACTLNVTHSTGEKTYANVTGVGKVMKGITVPDRVNDLVYLWLHPSRWDAGVFSTLSANLQTKIMSSPEYLELMNERDRGPQDHNGAADDQEIPF